MTTVLAFIEFYSGDPAVASSIGGDSLRNAPAAARVGRTVCRAAVAFGRANSSRSDGWILFDPVTIGTLPIPPRHVRNSGDQRDDRLDDPGL